MSNITESKMDLFEFELEIMIEKKDPNREEWHRFNVIARNHDEVKSIVDKHDFRLGEVSWTKYSVDKMDRKPTTKYTEPRLINYSFVIYNDDDDESNDESDKIESNLIQLQGWQEIVKENKDYNLKYNLNKDVEITELERYIDPLADLVEKATKYQEEEATKNRTYKNNGCCIIM